jgi:hypothetical protein
MTPILNVRNVEQAALMLEIDGQLSDGFWENARPYGHWKVWCNAKVVVNPENVGRNFYADKTNYNLTAKELLDVVGLRMLGLCRIARKLGIDRAKELEFSVDCNGTLSEKAFKYETDAFEIIAALTDSSYTLKMMKADLADLKTIFKVFSFKADNVQL